MPDKLARAQHTPVDELASAQPPAASQRGAASHARAADPGSTSEIFVGGRHAGLDRTAIAAAVAQQVVPRPEPRLDPTSAKARLRMAPPGETSEIHIGGRHAGHDRTTPPRDPFEPQTPDPFAPAQTGYADVPDDPAPWDTPLDQQESESAADPSSTAEIKVVGRHTGTDKTLVHVERDAKQGDAAAVGSSAALISVCTIISRVLGFVRTWTMAFALGSTLLSSSYQVANNLPAQLYELVIGGILVTGFLPVYLSVKKKLGKEASNDYASSLLTIVVVLLGIVTALCIAFPAAFIYTQSFYSDQQEMAQSVFFFQFFAVQIVFSGATAIISGLLNANRDYLWSAIAPAAQNIIVIASFLLYGFLAPQNPEVALYAIAIGNPLGVFVALAIQLPALKRNGIRLRPHINFRDPALREMLSLGIPALFVMICSFVVVSVEQAAAYSFADNGPSILLYARQWFTLPYSFLAVPITTAMFTELSDMHAEGNIEGVKRGIISGINQILFFMIPFMMYLMIFSVPLITVFHAGAFTMDNVTSIASYMSVLAIALPGYGLNTYLQKICSSLRRMGVYAGFNFVASAAQVAITMFGAAHPETFSIEIIAWGCVLFYVVGDLSLLVYLRYRLGPFGLRSVIKACATSLIFGGLGAAAGAGVLFGLETFVGPLSGSIAQAFAYVAAGGIVALIVTFGLAIKLRIPEAAFVGNIVSKVSGKVRRG